MQNHAENTTPAKLSRDALLKSHQRLEHEVKNLREELAFYEEKLRLLTHQRFAPKSEVTNPNQPSLFNEAETIAAESADADVDTDGKERKPRKRGRPFRKPLPENLPREIMVIDIPEADKVCPASGAALVKIGEEVSEQLQIVPAKFTVLEIHRPKYICKCDICEQRREGPAVAAGEGSSVKIAPVEPQPIPKSMASPGLLAHVIVNKYADALPLHRQEEIFQRLGIDLPRATLASWVIRCGGLVQPILDAAKAQLLMQPVIQCDETHIQVLKQNGKKSPSKSYMWVFLGGGRDGPPIVLYEFGPSRAHTVPLAFLGVYEGFIQSDGYEAYETLAAKNQRLTLVGDWVHVRRRFDEAVKAVSADFKGEIKAKVGLDMINELFRVEREMGIVDDAARLAVRREQSRPIVDAIKDWAAKTTPTVPPKSLTGRALAYMNQRWEKLVVFLDHACLRADTNPVENAIRPFVVGRNNWLFSSSVDGARASAALYSLISMAKHLDLNPFDYLKSVLTELPRSSDAISIERLLPWNWKAANAAAAE